MGNKKITVSFTDRTVIRVVVIVVLTFIGLAFFQKIAHAVTLIALSAFLAIALNPAVSWLGKKLRIKSRVAATGEYACPTGQIRNQRDHQFGVDGTHESRLGEEFLVADRLGHHAREAGR